MRIIFCLAFMLMINTTYSQTLDILSTTKYDYFDSKSQLKSSKIHASVIQNKKTLQVEIKVDKNNSITDLKINDKVVAKPRISSYSNITRQVLAEANDAELPMKEYEKTRTKTIVKRPTDPTSAKKLTAQQRKSLMMIIKKQLIFDKLLENEEVFDFMLTIDSLYINAKKQPQVTFERYRDLYNANTDVPVKNGTYFQITQTL